LKIKIGGDETLTEHTARPTCGKCGEQSQLGNVLRLSAAWGEKMLEQLNSDACVGLQL
jgi:hypothetical protein